MLTDFHKRQKFTLRELQSLTGLLNFTCSVVSLGRAFLRRLFDLTKGVRRPHHRIRLSKACRKDISVWLTFLEHFSGSTFFVDEERLSHAPLKLYPDPAGSKGYDAIFGRDWFYGEWPDSWKKLNIAFFELFPIALSLHVWGGHMSNQCVSFFPWGVFPEKFGRGMRPASQTPCPIYDQNLRFSLPYLLPDQKFDTLFIA